MRLKTKKVKQTENEVKKAIKEYLEIKGFHVFRINNSGVYRGLGNDGKAKFSFAGSSGVSDLFAFRLQAGHGVSLWVETKATGKRPTPDQHKFLYKINLIGDQHWGLWADSLDMFIDKVESNKVLEGKGK